MVKNCLLDFAEHSSAVSALIKNCQKITPKIDNRSIETRIYCRHPTHYLPKKVGVDPFNSEPDSIVIKLFLYRIYSSLFRVSNNGITRAGKALRSLLPDAKLANYPNHELIDLPRPYFQSEAQPMCKCMQPKQNYRCLVDIFANAQMRIKIL